MASTRIIGTKSNVNDMFNQEEEGDNLLLVLSICKDRMRYSKHVSLSSEAMMREPDNVSYCESK